MLQLQKNSMRGYERIGYLSYYIINFNHKFFLTNYQDVSFIKAISLIMLDEVQTLGETRGATLEAVISRLKLVRSRSPNSEKLRFIAVSATCPNINEIGDWLNTPQSNVCVFGDEYRPVKLYTQVIGYPCKSSNKFLFHQNLKYRVFDLIMRYYDGKPTLLFCGTRKDTINTSQQILKDIQEKKNPFILNQEQKSKLLIASRTISNQPLKELIIHGIGFYHAGLSYADRNSIQELYISNLLYVICTTSSLAQGVNLPAHLVIIQGTEMYKSGSFEDTSLIDITQMMGRAGRPQFDTSGNVVIMTRDECKKKYENFLSGMEMIESSMMDSIPSFLNSEIVLGTINNIHDSIEWIKSTFLYHRIRSNPSRYGIPSGLTVARLDQILKQLCMKALKDLEEFQMITIRQNDGTLCALNSGKYMAKYYIHFETMKLFTTLTPTTSIQELLTLLSHSGEFSQMSLRRSEKLLLNKLHAQIKYPNKKTEKKLELVKTREDKIYVLIQAILSDEEITDWSLKQEALQIFNILPRIMNGIRSFLSEKKYFISLMNSIFLIQSIQQKIWFDSDQITRQLEKIGKILSQTLSNRGLNSFQKLVEQDPRDLERILNRNPPFGTQLIQSVIKIWPNFEVEIHKEMSINTQKVNNLEVRLRARNAIEKAGKYKNSQNYSSLIVGDVENSLLLYDIKVPHSEVAFQQFKVPIGDSTSIKCYILREDYIGMTTVIDFDAKTSTIIESSDPNNYIQKTEENYPSNTPNDEYRNNNHNYNQSYENSYKYQSINPDDNEIEEDFDDESEDLPNFSVVPEEAISNKITTACKHNCKDKQLCKHECCKSGLKKSPQEKKIDDYYPISKPITRITSNYMNNNSFGVKGNNEAPTPTPTNARHPPDYYNPYSSKINYHYQLNNEQSVNNNYSPNPSSGIDTKNHYPLTNWSAQDNKQSLNHMQTNNNHYTEKPLDYLSAEEDFTKDKNLFQEFVKEYGYVSKDQPKPMTRIVDHNNRLTSNYANSNRQINNAKINSQADINSNKDAQTKEQLEDEIRELKMQLQQIKSNTGTNQLQNQIQTPKPTSVNTHKELSKITHNNNYGNNSSSAKYQSHIMPRPVQSLESQQYNSYPSGTHMANFFPSSETHSLSYEPFSYKSETIVTPAVIKKPQEGSKWYSLAKSFAQNKQNSNN